MNPAGEARTAALVNESLWREDAGVSAFRMIRRTLKSRNRGTPYAEGVDSIYTAYSVACS